MVRASDDELQRNVEENLAAGAETRRFEAKGPGTTSDRPFVARVARAVMAMGNLRDGGMVCIGVDDIDLASMGPGLDDAQLAEWSDGDTVADKIASYSDPPATFAVRPLTLSNGAKIVVLLIDEFETAIHVCKKDMSNVLQTGQTYVRPRGKPRSAQVPSLAEMRELHDLAIDKGVREFVRRAAAAGLLGQLGSLPLPPTPQELDTAQFDREAELAWAEPSAVDTPEEGTLVPGIVTAAYTDIAIRPGPYQADRIERRALESFITQHAVSMRGWPVPMISTRHQVQHLSQWIRQDMHAAVVPHAEAWRLFTSGQFLQRRIVATDLRDAGDLRPVAPGASGAIAIWDVLLYLVEVAELGARIATAIGANTVTFDIALRNVAGRELISGDLRRRSARTHVTHEPRLSATAQFALTDLIAQPRQRGVDLAQLLLQQFGADITDQTLLDWQAQIFDGR